MKDQIPLHFKGKQALEHVIEARQKGRVASAEVHGAELPGHFGAAADAAKETAILIVFWMVLGIQTTVIPFVLAYAVWKGGRSALLGWARLERLHRLIEEERWEIEHHRPQEKEELKALYKAKGFSGKLLDDCIEVLMADDNRLLQVMLEEELGLNLESFEHPLKQAVGAFTGVIVGALILWSMAWMGGNTAMFITSIAIVAIAAGITAALEKNKPLPSIVWNLATAGFSVAVIYYVAKLFALTT
ncbi:MAG: hypothetical protein RL235_182 [Chlamydiota bacterium]|jgi:hypothetical protein